jgi:hypothetical protein
LVAEFESLDDIAGAEQAKADAEQQLGLDFTDGSARDGDELRELL